MRQCVSFKCSVCGQPIATTFYLRITAKTITILRRFCSLQCLRSWVGSPG
jgi:hypothetical protein